MSPNARFWLCLVIAIALHPRAAQSVPLDPFDATPRTVRVEFEVSDAPGELGVTYSAPLSASYSATGNIGTLSMPGAVYETVAQILDYFGFPLIPSSSDDFVIALDLTTLEASVQTLSYQVDIDVQGVPQQTGTITRSLGTDFIAGFVVVPSAPAPAFCTQNPPPPFPPCTPVQGSAYDPVTGKLNAVGSDALVAPDVSFTSFSRAGDVRLTEIPEPATALLVAAGIFQLALRARFTPRRGRKARDHPTRR